MTPLEIAAKAAFENDDPPLVGYSWDYLDKRRRDRLVDDMRAALRALAEAKMPETIEVDGSNALQLAILEEPPAGNRAKASAAFRAMLLAIAEEKL